MATLHQILGALFEEAILFLPKNVGCETIEGASTSPGESVPGNGCSDFDV